MDLYEYQAKDLFAAHGVPVLPGSVAATPAEARAIAEQLGQTVVVKAQVKTGGRGKAGGVKLADNPDDAQAKAEAILGLDIKGHITRKVLVTPASDIAEEYYVSFLLDRANRTFLAMASAEGGMEIEQLAVERPEALAKIPVDACDRVDRDARQCVGPLDGQLLDLHAALGRAHGQERAVAAVEQEGEVVLLGDVGGLGDQHAVHGVALDVHAEDRGRLLARLLRGVRELHPARLAAAARLHLGLDDDGRAQLRRGRCRRLRVFHGATRQHRHSVSGEELLRLVLVQVHWLSTPLRRDSC